MHFPLKATVSRSYQNSVVVERGPIVFSLNIPTEWRKLRARAMTSDWEAHPRGSWNYALDASEITEMSAAKKSGAGVFTLDGSPVCVQVQGRKVPEWQGDGGYAGELPQAPVSTIEPAEALTLVPYAAAKLRITAFPELEKPASSLFLRLP
jgi:hypothetical protein